MHRILFCLGLLCVFSEAWSQGREVQRDNFIWATYAINKPLNEQVKLTLSVQSRRYAFPDRQHQIKPLVLITKKYKSGVTLGAGFSYFLQASPINRNDVDVVRPELRPHQEITIGQNLGKWSLSQRLMIEERWIRNAANGELVDGHTFQMRIRFRLIAQRALDEHELWFGVVSTEAMFNAGRPEITNVFDQNRLYLGVKRKLSKKLNADVGYMYWYQQFPSIKDFASFHIINLAISHTL